MMILSMFLIIYSPGYVMAALIPYVKTAKKEDEWTVDTLYK